LPSLFVVTAACAIAIEQKIPPGEGGKFAAVRWLGFLDVCDRSFCLRPLFHFSGFDANDAERAHRFVLHRLSPWLGALFPELVVGFFAGELED
jgi:hypothetical protein